MSDVHDKMRATLARKSAESERAREQVRDILGKHDPHLLAFCDAAKTAFEARLTGLRLKTSPPQALGELLPKDAK